MTKTMLTTVLFMTAVALTLSGYLIVSKPDSTKEKTVMTKTNSRIGDQIFSTHYVENHITRSNSSNPIHHTSVKLRREKTIHIPSGSKEKLILSQRYRTEMGEQIFNTMHEFVEETHANLLDRLPLNISQRLNLRNLLVLKEAYRQENSYGDMGFDNQTLMNNPYDQEIELLLGDQYSTYLDYENADQERLQITRMNRYLGESHKLDTEQQWAITSAMYEKRKRHPIFEQIDQIYKTDPSGPTREQAGKFENEAKKLTEEYSDLLALTLSPRQQAKLIKNKYQFWPGIE